VYPATLSKPVLTDLLRDKLGFDGIILSDDLQMKAITDEYGFKPVVRQAIEAGIDILVFANNGRYQEEIVQRAVTTIGALIREGIIPRERIVKSYQRIRRLKQRLLTTSRILPKRAATKRMK
jgi:beta-N-acetylhexosaminidase